MRRSAQDIADSWSNDIFGSGYTSDVPYVKARLYWVAEELASLGYLKGARIVDVGAGEGALLRNFREREPSASLVGIDPGNHNVDHLRTEGFEAYCGTVQDVVRTGSITEDADLVTLTWTLENSNDCREVLADCRRLLNAKGRIAVATGSRLLVPFKKPLDAYLTSERPPDTHAFRFSRNSLVNLMHTEGFVVEWENHWLDSDWMLIVARVDSEWDANGPTRAELLPDPPEAVLDFFKEWHRNTQLMRAWVGAN